MHIDVPYIRQPRNSMWCGAASATMVLKWHGLKATQPQAARQIPVTKNGVTEGRLAQYLLSKGMDVTIQFWLPGIEPRFRGCEGDRDSPKLMDALQRGASQCRHSLTRMVCKDILAFVKRGGSVRLNPPFFRDIKYEISKKCPVILCVDARWLRSHGRFRKGHYVVAIGFTDNSHRITWPSVHVHDPKRGPNRSFYFDELLYACHRWDGVVIFAKPRS